MDDYTNEFYEDVPYEEETYNQDVSEESNPVEEESKPVEEETNNINSETTITIKDLTEILKTVTENDSKEESEKDSTGEINQDQEEEKPEEVPEEVPEEAENQSGGEIQNYDYTSTLTAIENDVTNGNAISQDTQEYIVQYIESNAYNTSLDSLSINTVLLICILTTLMINILIKLIRGLF